eukprot:1156138-Pelagomonas_calceolata.AAC.20
MECDTKSRKIPATLRDAQWSICKHQVKAGDAIASPPPPPPPAAGRLGSTGQWKAGGGRLGSECTFLETMLPGNPYSMQRMLAC